MAKSRMVNTKFWSDSFVQNLNPIDKLLFLYFLTNEHTNIAGLYEISMRSIEFETGIKEPDVLQTVHRLSQAGKLYYFDGWIFIKNFIRHQQSNPSVHKGIENEFSKIPKEIIEKSQTVHRLYTECDTQVHLNLNLNLNSNLNLKKVGEQKKISAHLPVGKVEETNLLESLKGNPAYTHLNLEVELGKIDAWLQVNKHRKKTKRFVVNWLNRAADRVAELPTAPTPQSKGDGTSLEERIRLQQLINQRKQAGLV